MPIRYPLVLLVGALALLLALRRARRRGRWRMVRAWRSRTLARRLFARHGANGVSYFATMGRTVRWVDPCRHGVVAYRVFGRTALAIGDPLAAPEHLPDVLAGFLAHCRRQGWTPAFYQTIDATLRAHLPAPAGLVRRLPPARWLPGGQWRRGKQSVAGQRAA